MYGDRLVAVGYSRLDGKHLLDSWIRLLALAADRPDHNWTALTIGRAARTTPSSACWGPPTRSRSRCSMTSSRSTTRGAASLPLPLKTSFAWASARHQTDQPPVEAALKKWKSGMYPAEDAERAHEQVWGERAPLERLLGPVPAG